MKAKLFFLISTLIVSTLAAQTSDIVATKYQGVLTRLKSDYDQKVTAIYTQMIAEYDRQILASSKDPERMKEFKEKKEAIKNELSLGTRIVGKWKITQSDNVSAVWIFNRNNTYNYWNETGKWKYFDGSYWLYHTWDWQIKVVDENTFEGTCTRGATCTIRGVRISH